MEENKIKFLKEKQIKKNAQKNAEFLEKMYAQNPIAAKFAIFKKTKENITIEDLF